MRNLLFAVITTGSLCSALPTHAQTSEAWLEKNKAQLSQPESLKSLSRELLAESLRISPEPAKDTEAILKALLKHYPQPEVQEALQPWPWSKGPMIDMVKTYRALTKQKDPAQVQKLLDLCYREKVRTCQADMLYLQGNDSERSHSERIASFVKGSHIARRLKHQRLYLLHQAGLGAYEEDLYEDTEDYTNLKTVIAQAKQQQFSEVEAVATLNYARYLWEDAADYKELDNLLETARANIKNPEIQIELLMLHGDIASDEGLKARARSHWNHALALLPPSQKKLRILLLQKLMDSYFHRYRNRTESPEKMLKAKVYGKQLLHLLPEDSPNYFKTRLKYIETLWVTEDPQARSEINQIKRALLSQPAQTRWQEKVELARMLMKTGQHKESQHIVLTLLDSADLTTVQRAKILQESETILNSEETARRALKLMTKEPFEVRKTAVFLLNKLKPVALLPELKALLHHKDHRVRNNAVQVVWYTEGKPSIPDLLPLLQDSNAGVRSNVLQALIKAKHVLPYSQLEKELLSTESKNRSQAVQLLLQQPEGKNKVISFALMTDHPLQETMIAHLFQLKLAKEDLKRALPLLFSENKHIRKQTYNLLRYRHTNTRALWEPLVELVKNTPHYSVEALQLLQSWEAPQATHHLIEWSKQSEKNKINYAYLFASSPIGNPSQQHMVSLLSSGEPTKVRVAATLGLLSSRNKEAWEQFSLFFHAPALGQLLPSPRRSYGQSSLRVPDPPCLPISAFQMAPHWLGSSHSHTALLNQWWWKTPVLIWNGKTCAAPQTFPQNQRAYFKKQLQPFANHRKIRVRKKVQQYLKALNE